MMCLYDRFQMGILCINIKRKRRLALFSEYGKNSRNPEWKYGINRLSRCSEGATEVHGKNFIDIVASSFESEIFESATSEVELDKLL